MVDSPHNSPTLKPPLSFPLRTEQRIPLIGIKTSCGGNFLAIASSVSLVEALSDYGAVAVFSELDRVDRE